MDFNSPNKFPVISSIYDFDGGSGSLVERLLFNNRPLILLAFLVLTVVFGFQAAQVKLNASFDKMIPLHQPFIVNYLAHYDDLQAQGNALRIVVTANHGSIINKDYLRTLQKINDEVYLLPGVDRPYMTSLWSPSTRWVAITPQGEEGGPVIDANYDGSAKSLAIVRQNIENTGKVGQLVSSDFTSSMIYVPLMETNNLTGKPLDYGDLARRLQAIRTQFASQGVTLHIVGFAMVVGDLINGINKILLFFLGSVIIATAALYWYTRCIRSTALVVTASLVAVVWQMGCLNLAGLYLNPYSVLVPFLIFAIGMSHGAQKMNGVMQDIGRGTHPLVAARFTFRRLFLAGFAALTCDAVSFAVLMTINIEAIRELAAIASVGVAILIFTNLIMLPILLSYTSVSKSAALRSVRRRGNDDDSGDTHLVWSFFARFTLRRYAVPTVVLAVVVGLGGWVVGEHVQVGDLDQGAPELRQTSQYNMDNAYILSHYTVGSDTFVVLVSTTPGTCDSVRTISVLDNLEWQLDQLPQVKSTSSVASYAEAATKLMNENSPKWFGIVKNQSIINDALQGVPNNLQNLSCSFLPLYVSLRDHKAATLSGVVRAVQDFAAHKINQGQNFKISLAGGDAGIAAATNIVIAEADSQMLYLVYGAVVAFCLITFRSWRATLCAVLPLMLTSVLCQALMVWLGIGIKVATLPVIALGVGIGVDYAIYVLTVVLKELRAGASLIQAYYRTLLFTGKIVLLTGFTLAAGVGTWIFAPIKFQADMGLLLAFMFLWNMLGAMILLPSLAYFLLSPSSTHRRAVLKEER